MKIELINENQIKCTLNRSDLASHQIKLSELAYGTDKTKDLFQDMMDQAFTEFGFEASDPLMVEAIPVSMDCIVLMITKVSDPDELDQKFAGLTNIAGLFNPEGEQENLDLNALIRGISKTQAPGKEPLERIFSFDSLDKVITFAHKAAPVFKGKSSLYRSGADGLFYLIITNSSKSLGDFGFVCSLALEYGSKEPSGFARSAFLGEHYETLIASRALQKLADI